MPRSSSSSSSSSSPRARTLPIVDDTLDPTPAEDRVDGHARRAARDDQRTVYLWTFAFSSIFGRAKPEDFTRESFAQCMVRAYEETGKVIAQWALFLEVHPGSKSDQEQRLHFHMIVETESPCRWLEMARHLREGSKVFASVATSSSRKSYWTAFAYLFAPSARKSKEDLDLDYHLSPGHEDPPQQLANRRAGIRRLQGIEIYSTIVSHNLNTMIKFYAYSARQNHAGDSAWLQHCMKQPERKLKEDINKALAMSSAEARISSDRMTHLEILREALHAQCTCEGRARPGWEHILVINGIDVASYRQSVLKMFASGGGKNANHMYVGEPNSGKTGLTKPLLKLFGSYAFLKPQVGTTFALQGLIGAKAAIWNDIRWPHPPLAWGDMLNMLDNEAFNVGVPKVDGQTDCRWNVSGDEGIIAVFTSNVDIVYITDNTINPIETQAWNERFGFIGHFKVPIKKPDPRFKKWFQCTRCYATWILEPKDADAAPPSPSPAENNKRGRTGRGPQSPEELRNTTASAVPVPVHMPSVPPLPSETLRATNFDDEDEWAGQMEDDGEFQPLHTEVKLPLASTAPLLAPSSVEPLRDLNLHFSRVGAKPVFSETQTPGAGWSCQVSGLGLTAVGLGSSKKAAKRNAADSFLHVLRSSKLEANV